MRNLAIFAVFAIGAFAYNAFTTADRDGTGNIVSEGNIDAFTVRLGDCFNDTAALASGEDTEIYSLPGVPCSEPHDNEVYAVFDMQLESYPEGDTMSVMAFDACRDRFEAFVGTDYDSSSLDISTLYPTADSWKFQNDREVVCAVFDVNAQKLTGSVEGTAI